MVEEYTELITLFIPKPINSEEEYKETQVVIDQLLSKQLLSEAESTFLELLGILIKDWDDRNNSIPDISGIELIRVLMKEKGLKQKDLVSIFGTEANVSYVLNGKRTLKEVHIEGLSKLFKVPPEVFLP